MQLWTVGSPRRGDPRCHAAASREEAAESSGAPYLVLHSEDNWEVPAPLAPVSLDFDAVKLR